MSLDENNKKMVVIPVYNHGATLRNVVEETLAFDLPVCVVDDGSDIPVAEGLCGLEIDLVRHPSNLGKGRAILSGAARARSLGMTHIITLDADGQHTPQDMPQFLSCLTTDPKAIWVGIRDMNSENVPAIARFGNRFSNFWMRVQTGYFLQDVLCGFRAYPLDVLSLPQLKESGYSFELEVLIRAAWAGFKIRELAIRVHYPSSSQRISHFDALSDSVLLIWLITRLSIHSIIPWLHQS